MADSVEGVSASKVSMRTVGSVTRRRVLVSFDQGAFFLLTGLADENELTTIKVNSQA